MTDSCPKNIGTLRWYAGVPIGSNPLVLFDVIRASFLLWGSTVFLVSLLQFFFEGICSGRQIEAAVGLANRLILLTGMIFLLIVLLLQNRYVVLCRLDDEGVYCESMRGGWGPLRESFHWRSFAVTRPLSPLKSVRKTVSWGCLDKAYPQESTRTILLKKGKVTVLRLYCPDESLFEQALELFEAKKIMVNTQNIPKNKETVY